ncbi:MAG: RNA methyltransferase [Clostridia bacterium]|nr:RNA methyltransferase [Clostridia bacterium]
MILNIDSPANDKVKRVVRLLSSARARREEGAFVLEGLRLCCDAAACGVPVQQFFFTENARLHHPQETARLIDAAEASFCVAPAVEKRLSDTDHPQGFFCVCSVFPPAAAPDPQGKYIALDCVRDPANLGAICRTAEALGISGAILFDCCDVYNPKAQRAAMGSLLRLPLLFSDDLCRTLTDCRVRGMRIFATTPDASARPVTQIDFCGGAVAVIGNEANGISPAVMSLCETITIPMRGRAESLNAAMAAALTMWEMLRQ